MTQDVKTTRFDPVVLRGEKVSLVLFSERHLTDEYVSWLNDPVVCRYNSHGSGLYTHEKARAYLDFLRRSDNTVVFAIHLHEGDRYIGNISINDISWPNRSGEISILIGAKDCWGSGYGTDAYRGAIEYGFKTLGLHRLWIGMTVDNSGMIRIAEKLGFEQEGILKEAFYKEGVFRDITQWSKTNPCDKES